jgi:2',3'-cyclic-nucleotide 2'-phosphodiesterase (5'-nucleotidase family)
MRHRTRTAAGALLLACCLAPALLAALPPPSGDLRLVYTANLRGVLDPCGCQALQPGGLARRAAFLQRLRQEKIPTLLLDAGDNLAPGRAAPEMLRFTYRTLRELGYHAVNVGPFDLALPAAQVREAAREAGLSLVGAPEPGRDLASASRILKAGRWKVAVVSAGARPGEPDAEQAIARTVAAVRRARRQADLVVVLSQLPPEAVERCAREAPEADLFISGRHDADLNPPERVGGARLLPCSLYGQGVGVAAVTFGKNGRAREVQVAQHRLDAQVARDPAVEEAVKRFYQEHATLSPEAARSAEATRTAETAQALSGALGGVLGGARQDTGCVGCHQGNRI